MLTLSEIRAVRELEKAYGPFECCSTDPNYRRRQRIELRSTEEERRQEIFRDIAELIDTYRETRIA